MRSYTVHRRRRTIGKLQAEAEATMLVGDGFSIAAFVIPFLWALYHRMWLVAIGFALIAGGMNAALDAGQFPPHINAILTIALQFLVALEAASLRRWSLSRKGYDIVAIVMARNETEAETFYFREWKASMEAHQKAQAERENVQIAIRSTADGARVRELTAAEIAAREKLALIGIGRRKAAAGGDVAAAVPAGAVAGAPAADTELSGEAIAGPVRLRPTAPDPAIDEAAPTPSAAAGVGAPVSPPTVAAAPQVAPAKSPGAPVAAPLAAPGAPPVAAPLAAAAASPAAAAPAVAPVATPAASTDAAMQPGATVAPTTSPDPRALIANGDAAQPASAGIASASVTPSGSSPATVAPPVAPLPITPPPIAPNAAEGSEPAAVAALSAVVGGQAAPSADGAAAPTAAAALSGLAGEDRPAEAAPPPAEAAPPAAEAARVADPAEGEPKPVTEATPGRNAVGNPATETVLAVATATEAAGEPAPVAEAERAWAVPPEPDAQSASAETPAAEVSSETSAVIVAEPLGEIGDGTFLGPVRIVAVEAPAGAEAGASAEAEIVPEAPAVAAAEGESDFAPVAEAERAPQPPAMTEAAGEPAPVAEAERAWAVPPEPDAQSTSAETPAAEVSETSAVIVAEPLGDMGDGTFLGPVRIVPVEAPAGAEVGVSAEAESTQVAPAEVVAPSVTAPVVDVGSTLDTPAELDAKTPSAEAPASIEAGTTAVAAAPDAPATVATEAAGEPAPVAEAERAWAVTPEPDAQSASAETPAAEVSPEPAPTIVGAPLGKMGDGTFLGPVRIVPVEPASVPNAATLPNAAPAERAPGPAPTVSVPTVPQAGAASAPEVAAASVQAQEGPAPIGRMGDGTILGPVRIRALDPSEAAKPVPGFGRWRFAGSGRVGGTVGQPAGGGGAPLQGPQQLRPTVGSPPPGADTSEAEIVGPAGIRPSLGTQAAETADAQGEGPEGEGGTR